MNYSKMSEWLSQKWTEKYQQRVLFYCKNKEFYVWIKLIKSMQLNCAKYQRCDEVNKIRENIVISFKNPAHFHSLLVMSLFLCVCVCSSNWFLLLFTCEFQKRKTNKMIWFSIIMRVWLSCVFTRYVHRKMCVHEKRMLDLFVIEAWGSVCACSCVGYFSVWTYRNRPSPTHTQFSEVPQTTCYFTMMFTTPFRMEQYKCENM